MLIYDRNRSRASYFTCQIVNNEIEYILFRAGIWKGDKWILSLVSISRPLCKYLNMERCYNHVCKCPYYLQEEAVARIDTSNCDDTLPVFTSRLAHLNTATKHTHLRSIVWLSALPSHIVFSIVFAQCITFACYLWFTYFALPFWIVCPADCVFWSSDCLCLFFWPCFCLMIVDYSALAFI